MTLEAVLNPDDERLEDWERELLFPVRPEDIDFVEARDIEPDLQGPLSTGAISYVILRERAGRQEVVEEIRVLLGGLSIDNAWRVYSYAKSLGCADPGDN